MLHMPEVLAAYRNYHSKGLRVLSVSIDDPGLKAKVRQVADKYDMPWPVIYDGGGGNGPLARRNRVTGIPATFLRIPFLIRGLGRSISLSHKN